LKDWAALGKLDGLVEVARFDEGIAADNVLGLGKGAVGDGLLLAFHELAGAVERLAYVLDVALVAEFFEPGHPSLDVLLPRFGRLIGHDATIKINKFAHLRASCLVVFGYF